MTALTLSRGGFHNALADGFLARFAALREALAKSAAYRRTYAELSSLGDRELDDLGLNRWTIARAAHDAVYGR